MGIENGYRKFKKMKEDEKMGFCWSTLAVKNIEESIAFYQEVVGLKVINRFHAGPDMEIAFLDAGETQIELVYDKAKKEFNIGQDISWGFTVDSVDKKIDFIKGRGIKILGGPFQPNPHTKFFFISDPNGMKIQFIENIN